VRRSHSILFGVEMLGWALWLGGLVSLALAAPLIFQLIPSRDLAGRVFGAMLTRLFPLIYVAAGGQLAAALLRDRRGWLKHVLVAVVLAIAAYSGIVVMGEMTQIQASLPGPIETLPLDDGPRARFDALHKLSERLMGVDAFLGLVLLPLIVASRPRRLPLEVQPGKVLGGQVERHRAEAVV
jgi:hypothetical protein